MIRLFVLKAALLFCRDTLAVIYKVDLVGSGKLLDLVFSLHGFAFALPFLPVNHFHRQTPAGVFAACALLMLLQSSVEIGGIACIVRLVAALQNINKWHGCLLSAGLEFLSRKNNQAGKLSLPP